ncbi:hypothetical protein OG239_27325 [Streptomyces sp. NBC_00868]|uniref:hypothetical protein n=1 Tax=unclassified Streptomyces TaxID=2593676 RepID=UPI0032566908|nr:hypothetical protein OG239_27325 [Streptomyces sp. NBC_00868]
MIIAAISVLLALPAVAYLLVKAFHLAVTRRPGMSRTASGQWSEGVWVCLSLAVIAFALGTYSGLSSRPVRPCVDALTAQHGPQSYRTPDADIKVDRWYFPVSTKCTFSGGVRVQVVPIWVNPLLIGSLAGAGVCARKAKRSRRPVSATPGAFGPPPAGW